MQKGQEKHIHGQVLVNKFTAVKHDISITNDHIFSDTSKSQQHGFLTISPPYSVSLERSGGRQMTMAYVLFCALTLC